MKIGIDARFYGEAGPGRYVKSIISHLEQVDKNNQYLVFLKDKSYQVYHPQNPNFIKIKADYPWYSFSEQFSFLYKLIRENLDILYVPHFNIPVFYPKKLVTAIPDLIMHSYSTEKGTTLPKFYFKFKKLVYRMVFWWAVIRSEKIIIPSNTVINEFKKTYPKINPKKYVLAYEGVDPDFLKNPPANSEQVLEKYQIKKPFILYVGSAYEHKNLKNLITAFKNLTENYSYVGDLVIAGKKDRFSEDLYKFTQSQKLTTKVLFPGLQSYVTDEEIICLRKEADLYVFPSLKEGFSLTPMEAQASGLPCAISDIPIHREIYEDTVEYFDPNIIDDMAKKINNLLNNPEKKTELVVKGKNHYKRFNWTTTAEITRNVFEQIH